MRFNIIGPGRVGQALAASLISTGKYSLCSVYHPKLSRAIEAVSGLKQGYVCESLSKLAPCDITFITTQDSVIGTTCCELAGTAVCKPNSLIVHMSGILSSDVLKPLRCQGLYVGTMHPLKAFRERSEQDIEAFKDIDCALEGSDETVSKLMELCHDLGSVGFRIKSENKAAYHAAACIASNYLVTLAAEARTLFMSAGVPEEKALGICTRLMQTSLDNLIASDEPKSALTGPLARGDISTIEKHIPQIHDPQSAALYRSAGLATLRLVDLDPHSIEKIQQLLAGKNG